MDYFNSLDKIEVALREYCFLMEDSDKYSDTFKVYMPTIMPLFNMNDKVKTWKDTYNKGIFLNDPACKVNTDNSMELQNYITVRRKRNSWFKYHPSTFAKGTRLLCELPEKNIRHIRLLDDDFNVDKVTSSKDVFVRNPAFEILDKIKAGDTVKVSYWKYTFSPISAYPGMDSIELDEEGIDDDSFEYEAIVKYFNVPPLASVDPASPALPAEFSSDDVESVAVLSNRKYYRSRSMVVGEATVSSVNDWGLVVTIDGMLKHILPDQILGFSKKAGEYYSYYEDNYNGGA